MYGNWRMVGGGVLIGLIIGFGLGSLEISREKLMAGASNLLGISREEKLAEVSLNKEKAAETEIENKEEETESEKEQSAQVLEKNLEGKTNLNINIDLSGAILELSAIEGLAVRGGGVENENNHRDDLNGEREGCVAGAGEEPSREGVIFSEINWMGSKSSPLDEWMELRNASLGRIDISGWEILNRNQSIKIKLKEKTILEKQEIFLLERGSDYATPVPADLVYAGALNDYGERLQLFDRSCRLVDEIEAYEAWPAGNREELRTMERNFANLAWHSSQEAGGTPGEKNSEPNSGEGEKSLPQVYGAGEGRELKETGGMIAFSEIQAGTTLSGSDEFIEFYNVGGNEVDLTGWSIKKKSSTGSESSLVASSRLEGKVILPGKKFLLVNEGGYKGGVVGDASWAKSNTIAYSNNALVLYDAEGNKVEEVSWEEIPKDQSYERVGDSWVVREVPEPENSEI